MARSARTLANLVGALAVFLLLGTVVLGALPGWAGRCSAHLSGSRLMYRSILLLAAAIPMHWIVLLTPMPHKPIAIVAILTIYHNLQYHRLIWFHNQKYSARPGVARGNSALATNLRQEYGAAALISHRLIFYMAFGILFGLIYQGPRQYLGYVGLRNGGASGASTGLSFATQLGISFLWGYAFIHYYLDSKIWRVRRDPSVGKALNMT